MVLHIRYRLGYFLTWFLVLELKAGSQGLLPECPFARWLTLLNVYVCELRFGKIARNWPGWDAFWVRCEIGGNFSMRKELTLLDICWSIFSSLDLAGFQGEAIIQSMFHGQVDLSVPIGSWLDFEGQFPRSVRWTRCNKYFAISARNRHFER